MGGSVSRTDYEWVYTQEPHKTRRKEMLVKYPEIRQLMGHDQRLAVAVVFMVLIQLVTAWLLSDKSWTTIFIMGYCFGGVINHSLTLAIHEIAHNLAFGVKYPLRNKLLGIFANLPLCIPYTTFFKKYHIEHHKYQGDEDMDVDIPSRLEGELFRNRLTKFVWLILQPFFYAIRPLFMRPKPVLMWDIGNVVIQVGFDLLLYRLMGMRSLVYLTAGTLMAMGVHPMAGHFISEHYMFKHGYETYSYYGPLNWITFNVGYHNEHHDFPNIPGSKLPEVKKIAPEYYDHLPHHTSWMKVLFDFVMDPDLGPYARIRRKRQ